MTIRTSTLRPGVLVTLSVQTKGNVHYDKLDLENKREKRQARAKWETTRTINDVDEYDAARKVQARARQLISSVCADCAHGLLCPESNADLLEEAIKDAEAVVAEFNATAKITRVRLYVMTGRVAPDDETAIRKINREVRELIDDMTDGVANLDAAVIRDAATRAKQVSKMLTPDAEAKVQIAVAQARDIAKQVVKAGEAAALKVDKEALRKIKEQRTAFLDISDEVQVARPKPKARAIELEKETN